MLISGEIFPVNKKKRVMRHLSGFERMWKLSKVAIFISNELKIQKFWMFLCYIWTSEINCNVIRKWSRALIKLHCRWSEINTINSHKMTGYILAKQITRQVIMEDLDTIKSIRYQSYPNSFYYWNIRFTLLYLLLKRVWMLF